MNSKNILITGGAGFVGSNLGIYLKKKYSQCAVIALDNLKRRGSELSLERLKKHDIEFIHGDIRNSEDLQIEKPIQIIIECSAEPSVLAGYGNNPFYLINTNLYGTVNCLELARQKKADVLFLSTSRVYPYDLINSLKLREAETRFEWLDDQSFPGWSIRGLDVDFPLGGPKTLYGATKLASELLLQEYKATYGIRVIINRCGVISGPWQFGKVDQGVFALWLLAHYFKRNLSYIGYGGTGKQVRDVLHISDLCLLIDSQLKNFALGNGKIYNIGGGRSGSLSLRETTELCKEITGNKIAIAKKKKERPGDVIVYITDNQLINKDYSWEPAKSPKELLGDIYRWVRENEKNILHSGFF